MRAGAFLLVLVALAAPARADRCGRARWAVKVGGDPDASRVAAPVDATVGELVGLPRPARPPARRAGAELQTYRVTATIIAYRLEPDGDVHMVIADDGGRTLVAEVPAPRCAQGSVWLAQIAAARGAIEARLHPTKRLQRARVAVTLTGAAFWDHEHGVEGAAENELEIHPVIGVEWR